MLYDRNIGYGGGQQLSQSPGLSPLLGGNPSPSSVATSPLLRPDGGGQQPAPAPTSAGAGLPGAGPAASAAGIPGAASGAPTPPSGGFMDTPVPGYGNLSNLSMGLGLAGPPNPLSLGKLGFAIAGAGREQQGIDTATMGQFGGYGELAELGYDAPGTPGSVGNVATTPTAGPGAFGVHGSAPFGPTDEAIGNPPAAPAAAVSPVPSFINEWGFYDPFGFGYGNIGSNPEGGMTSSMGHDLGMGYGGYDDTSDVGPDGTGGGVGEGVGGDDTGPW